MNLSSALEKCPDLSLSYCRNIDLSFSCSLQQLPTSIKQLSAFCSANPLTNVHLIPSNMPQPKYKAAIIGGTFDYLHIGHQLLILTALYQVSQRLLVGITGEALLGKKKNVEVIQHIEVRKQAVRQYVGRVKPQIEIEFAQLSDPFGPAIVREDFQAIFVSEQTKGNGFKINQIRKQRNLNQFEIEVCHLVSPAEQTIQAKVSSSQTRAYILHKNRLTAAQFREYKQSWSRLLDKVGSYLQIQVDKRIAELWWSRVMSQYSESWRYYHTNHHIYQMLAQYEQSQLGQELKIEELLAMEFAIWFHDVEYLPYAKNNEELSAETFRAFMSQLAPEISQKTLDFINLTCEIIISTKGHKAESKAAKHLIDLDMSILDSPAELYLEYAANIRKEYEPSFKESYAPKRIEFLKSLKPAEIFYFRKGTHLQSNIQAELNILALTSPEL